MLRAGILGKIVQKNRCVLEITRFQLHVRAFYQVICLLTTLIAKRARTRWSCYTGPTHVLFLVCKCWRAVHFEKPDASHLLVTVLYIVLYFFTTSLQSSTFHCKACFNICNQSQLELQVCCKHVTRQTSLPLKFLLVRLWNLRLAFLPLSSSYLW